MPIHEQSLIRPENLKTHDQLIVDGVDVSGHWSTFIESRVVTDYNEAMQEESAALPGGEYIHRCWPEGGPPTGGSGFPGAIRRTGTAR